MHFKLIPFFVLAFYFDSLVLFTSYFLRLHHVIAISDSRTPCPVGGALRR